MSSKDVLNQARERNDVIPTKYSLRPTKPSSNRRYNEAAGARSTSAKPLSLPPGLSEACKLDSSQFLQGWETYVHPEGKPYFYHGALRIVTGSNLLIQRVLSRIMEAYESLDSEMEGVRKAHDDACPEDAEVFLELNENDSCDYYLVSPRHHSVFWASEGGHGLNLPNDASKTTIKMKLEEEYWIHSAFFPAHRALPTQDEDILRAVLIFTCADQMTAPGGSTSHLTPDECRQYLSLLDSAKLLTMQGSRTWLIARLMTTITRNRNHNHYGQEGARLDRSQPSLHAVERPLTIFSWLVDGPFGRYILFNAHLEYHRSIQLTAVDDVVLPQAWRALVATCQRDWCGTMAMALIFVLANTSLICGTSDRQDRLHVGTISAVFSLSSFSLALYQYQTHRGMETTNAYEAAEYLQRAARFPSGYISLAVYLSLSYVLLVWAVAAFALAILLDIQLY